MSMKFQTDEKSEKNHEFLLHGIWDTCLFGLYIKWVGFVVVWQVALLFGFRECMIAFAVMTTGYGLLMSSLAEMVSVIAFPGGYYGYARCAVHPFFGYLVGCSGIIENVVITASTCTAASGLITIVCRTDKSLEPLWWMIFHTAGVLAHIQPRRVYWYMMITVTTICALICIVYFMGTAPKADFNKYVPIEHSKVQEDLVLQVLFVIALFYAGTDLMVVTSYEVKDSKRVVPRAMIITFLLLVLISLATIFSTASYPPGLTYPFDILSNAYAWSFAYSDMLQIPMHLAAAYALLPLLSSMFGYLWVGGRGVRSMAMSGLLPKILASDYTFTKERAPLAGTIAVSSFAILFQAIGTKYPEYDISVVLMFYASFFTYMGMFICYAVFKSKYSNLERTYQSPFGIPGAVVGFTVFVFGVWSIVRLEGRDMPLITYGAWMGAFVLYYIAFGERYQTFASTEQQEFFKVYLINMNRRRRAGVFKSKYLFWKSLMPSRHASKVYAAGPGSSASSDPSTSDKHDFQNLQSRSNEETTGTTVSHQKRVVLMVPLAVDKVPEEQVVVDQRDELYE